MNNSLNLKNKIILLVLLTTLLGVASLFQNNNSVSNKFTVNPNLQNDNLGDKNSINCDDYKSDLSVVMENQKEENSNSCLFIGCSGINF